jgi:hypothetical protein
MRFHSERCDKPSRASEAAHGSFWSVEKFSTLAAFLHENILLALAAREKNSYF